MTGMGRRTVLDLELILAHRTQRAVLVKDAEDSAGVWLPLSQVEVEGEPGQVATVTLPEWLAIEKGLV